VTVAHIEDAGAVNTFAGPDTADRDAAFAGLTAQERFVQALYLAELGRAGSKAELDGGGNGALDAPGGSRQAVASGIAVSPEARDHLVRGWYLTFLGRQANGGEEQGWVDLLLSGQGEEQALSRFLGGPGQEFYGRAQALGLAGTADQGYV